MAGPLTSISNRLTPSVPIELTFGAQPVATGKKFTTIFGHRAASGGSGVDYGVYTVVNVGDPTAAKTEVDALAGSNSQLGKMAYAFVAANAFSGVSNFPAFRVVILPNAELHFGPAAEAIDAVKNLRSDMFVSPYGAADSTNRTTILNLAILISGPDRDLKGQFGSFVTFGSLEALATQVTYAINSRYALVAALPDTNVALVNTTGDTTSGSNVLTALATTVGINKGAVITGTGIPVGTTVESTTISTVTMSANATSTNSAEALAFQNVVSQALEVVAAAHAGRVMASAVPYNPLTNVEIGGLIPPRKSSDIIDLDPNGESEQALVAGLSPLTVIPGDKVAFVRTRTTFTTLPGSITVTDYFDWQQLVVINDFREVCYQVAQLPPFNNNPGGTKASQQIASQFKDEVIREAQAFEDAGMFQNVKLSAKFFVVQVSTTSRGRFDFKIPVDVLPGLYVIAGNIEAVSDLTTFTL